VKTACSSLPGLWSKRDSDRIGADFHAMNILYLENHTIFAHQVIKQFLSEHRVNVVPSLSAARSAISSGDFDLVLSDYDLDDGKGDVFVRECRAAHPGLPIVAVSAHDKGNAALTSAGASTVCGKMQFDRIQQVIAGLAITPRGRGEETGGLISEAIKTTEVVEAFISAINQHDLSKLSSLMADDHTFVDSTGKSESGRANMLAGWNAYFMMFPDYEITVEQMVGEGTFVAVFGTAAGTYDGKRGRVPENRIQMPAAWRAEVVNGRIKLWQVYADWTEGWKIIEEDQRVET
jgi:ketosteroid isomerase-like protein